MNNMLVGTDKHTQKEGEKETSDENALADRLMTQFNFKTMRDNEEIYFYDEIKGSVSRSGRYSNQGAFGDSVFQN